MLFLIGTGTMMRLIADDRQLLDRVSVVSRSICHPVPC
jgi:hypothetical protein